MPKFKYQTVNKKGKKTEGSVEAVDRFEVYKKIRKEGETVVSVTEVGKKFGVNLGSFERLKGMIGTVKDSEKVIFTRNMSAKFSNQPLAYNNF